MAKQRKAGKSPKRRSPPKAPKFSYLTKKGVERRDERGHFVSREDWALRSREIQRRLASKVEREQELARLRKKRQKEVERLREARHKRTRTKTGRTKAAFKADTDAQRRKRESEVEADWASLAAGELPAPTEESRVGQYRVLLWRWYGADAIELAGEFIRAAKEEYGPSVMGRVAVGSGYGKDAQWVGTRTLPLYDSRQRDDLWWALQRLTATVSGKEVVGTPDDGMNDVWVEVELILPKRG